jgi:hypothetical protein
VVRGSKDQQARCWQHAIRAARAEQRTDLVSAAPVKTVPPDLTAFVNTGPLPVGYAAVKREFETCRSFAEFWARPMRAMLDQRLYSLAVDRHQAKVRLQGGPCDPSDCSRCRSRAFGDRQVARMGGAS